jgi:hypothetical protein
MKLSRTGVKESLAISISILALAVAVTSLFFGSLRLEDNVSMLMVDSPSPYIDGREFAVSSEGEATLIFINSGNRAASILSLSLYFVVPGSTTEECGPPTESDFWFRTSFEPVVIKASDVVSRKIKLKGPVLEGTSIKTKKQTKDFSFPFFVGKEEEIPVSVCLFVMSATPSRSDALKSIHVVTYWAHKDGGVRFDQGPGDKPRSLVNDVSTIFTR